MATAFIRTIVLYLLVSTTLRVMGKRQIGELSSSEFVITMLFSELAATPMGNPDAPLAYGIIPVLTLLALEILISSLFLKSRRIRKFAVGKTSILIENGKINQEEMKRIRLTLDELIEEIRLKNFINISHVKYAILESNGELSVFPFGQEQAPSRSDVGKKDDNTFLPHTVISDGVLIENEIERLGKSSAEINDELKRRGIASHKDVFLMQIDEQGTIFLVPKEGKK